MRLRLDLLLLISWLLMDACVDAAASGARRRKASAAQRRSRLAKSCGGEIGSVLLEEWFRHSQLVLTAAVEHIDRHSGTLNVTLRRMIRARVNVSDWAPWRRAADAHAETNALDPMPPPPPPPPATSLVLYGLFAARHNSCVPQFRIRVHDVLIFLLRAEPKNQTLHLVSLPLRVTLRNLRMIHSSPGKQTAIP